MRSCSFLSAITGVFRAFYTALRFIQLVETDMSVALLESEDALFGGFLLIELVCCLMSMGTSPPLGRNLSDSMT